MGRFLFLSPIFPALLLACERHIPAFETTQQLLARYGSSVPQKRAEPFPPKWTANEELIHKSFDNVELETWLSYYTHGDHVAGHNKSMAEETARKWNENGVPTSLAEYEVFLNYPERQELVLKYGDGKTHKAQLFEDKVDKDETTGLPGSIPAFHGYSTSGEVEAEYVYVGRGHKDDFAALKAANVTLEGKIALIKYGGPFRGTKVKNAEANGMVGAVIFTDPGDDGPQEAKGDAPYPNGPARHPSSVQRGSVIFVDKYTGDPTTPGYASKPGVAREANPSNLPKIPSVPISQRDATPMLKALDGHGISGAAMKRGGWVGGLNATYSTGPAPGITLSLTNLMKESFSPIWNVIGIINGTNADETIIIGNHRDAWIIGGAADPNSGTAMLIEITKAFGKLGKTGWKPRRNIVFASWDAEEYGIVGSTEWVEEYAPWLSETAITYLNVDIAVNGPLPGAFATPEVRKIAQDVMKKVVYGKRTLYDAWHDLYQFEPIDNGFGDMGSGSDYTPFLQLGIGALDFGFGGRNTDPVYHYHSDYDSFYWMKTFIDPDFSIHTTCGQFMALLTLHLADDPVIPFDLQMYSDAFQSWILKQLDEISGFADVPATQNAVNFSELADAHRSFQKATSNFKSVTSSPEFLKDEAKVKDINKKLRDFQRLFIKKEGLPGRPFYKNALFAPSRDSGYSAQSFPGTIEGLQDKNLTQAKEWNLFLIAAINAATEMLALN